MSQTRSSTAPTRSCSRARPPQASTQSSPSRRWFVSRSRWSAAFHPRATVAAASVTSDSQAISQAAISITESIDVQAIAAFTRTGFSARIVSKDRPSVPVYAFVPNETIAHRLMLDWAVQPRVLDFGKTTDELIAAVEEELLSLEVVVKGQAVVLVGGTPLGVAGRTNLLKILRPGEETGM